MTAPNLTDRELFQMALDALWTSANPKAEEAISALQNRLAAPQPAAQVEDDDVHCTGHVDYDPASRVSAPMVVQPEVVWQVIEAVRGAAKESKLVFKDSCDHTHDAIEYLLSAIESALGRIAPAAQPSEEDKRDGERLDFVLKNGTPMRRDARYRYHGYASLGWFDTQIEAIDAAIAAAAAGKGPACAN